MGCHFLLQGLFLSQESNPGLHCRQILYRLSHQGSPFILIACSIYITTLREKAVHHVKMGSLYTLILCVDVSQITQEVPDLRVVSITLSKTDTHTTVDYYVSRIPVQWYLKIPGLMPAVVFSSTSSFPNPPLYSMNSKSANWVAFTFFYIFLVCLNQWYSMECDFPRNPWGIRQCLEMFLMVMTNGMQLASSRRRPGYC